MQYLIDTSSTFRGYAQSVIERGIVAYSGGLTLEQYRSERGDHFKAIGEPEYMAMVSAFNASLVTEPHEISADKWDSMIGELPPMRWHRHLGVELFASPELLTGTITRWCAKLNGQYYAFNDHENAPSCELAEKVAAAQV